MTKGAVPWIDSRTFERGKIEASSSDHATSNKMKKQNKTAHTTAGNAPV